MRRAALAAVFLAAACGGGRTDAAAAPPFDPKSPGPVEMPGEPMSEPFPWRPVAAAGAAALVAAALVARRIRRASPGTPTVRAAPTATVPAEGPHVRALQRVAVLRARAPRTPDDHIETAAIARDYVHDRFGIAAGERTTDELLAAPQIAPAARRLLADVLRPCDLVKFARDEPTAAARAAVLDAAESFIRGTAAP